VIWNEFSQFGVVRGLKSREGWAKHWNHFIFGLPREKPKYIQGFSQRLTFETGPTCFEKDKKPGRQKGGSIAARSTLESFLNMRGRFYSKQMSSPQTAWEACSRLSPYLSFGNISLKEVWHATELLRFQGFEESGWKASLAAFTSRLRWHCHFIQKLEDEPEIEFQNMNRQMDGLRENEFQSELFEAWKAGETGYPLVDACMRSLHHNGWINFRMRAMLVSFSSYHLWLHWRKPALYLAKQFLDFEPGIHYSQIQMQSGTTGINAVRIYSPIKQVADQDPEGTFIKRWVPELSQVPTEHIAEPHKMPKAEQKKYGCVVGKDYPAPVVEHAVAYQAAKKRVFSWRAKKEVREASKQVYLKHGSRRKRNP
jgi:deoxyribodipyrimidine photo-lyase